MTADDLPLMRRWLDMPHVREWWGEPDDNVMGIGSGGNFALAAARALLDTDLDAEAIARKAMAIAAEICVYTNDNLVIESLPSSR